MIELILYSSLCIFLLAIFIPLIKLQNLQYNQIAVTTGLGAFSSSLLIIFAVVAYLYKLSFEFELAFLSKSLLMVFYVDGLALFFLLLIGMVSLGVIIYSYGYVKHYGLSLRINIFISLTLLLILSMIFLILSASILAFMFWWELAAITTFVLILYLSFYNEQTRVSAVFYFIMTQLSTVLLFLTFFTLARSSGSFLIKDLEVTNRGSTGGSIIFILLFLAFGIKAGLVPFHKWLIYAHPEAPSNISALLSGITINLAVYGFLRFSQQLFFAGQIQKWWAFLIIIIGMISAFLGIVYALKEQDIKRVLAYSSVENIGIIFSTIGLYFLFTFYNQTILARISLAAVLLHVLNHAIYKSLLFMSAGSVVQSTQTRDSEQLGGLIKTMPKTSGFYLIGCLSISGFPPFNGFVSEVLIFQLLILSNLSGFGLQAFMIVILSIFSFVSAMVSVTFVKAFGTQFLALPRSEAAKNAHESNIPMLIGLAIPATQSLLIGVFSYQILSQFNIKTEFPNLLFVSLLLLVSYFLVWYILSNISNQNERISDTWGCGIPSQNSKMEYTPTGFSEPLVSIFSTIYRTKKPRETLYYDTNNAIMKEGFGGLRLISFFEVYLYFPVARFFLYLSRTVRRLYNNKTSSYIGFTLFGILSVFLILIYG